jgi:hypothetical protein
MIFIRKGGSTVLCREIIATDHAPANRKDFPAWHLSGVGCLNVHGNDKTFYAVCDSRMRKYKSISTILQNSEVAEKLCGYSMNALRGFYEMKT